MYQSQEVIEIRQNYSNILMNQLISRKITNNSQQATHLRTTLKIVLGNLFVCGYRIFKRIAQKQVLIFYKKNGFQTVYGYFKLMQSYNDQFSNDFMEQINACTKMINRLKRSEFHSYKIFICYTKQKSFIEIFDGSQNLPLIKSNCPKNKQQLLSIIPQNSYQINKIEVEPRNRDRELQHDSSEQFDKLKDILYHYIDTFGQNYKTNYYVDLQKKCMTSFRISYLINTINYIICEESGYSPKPNTLSPTYNQLQSSSWTIFLKKDKKMKGDRKDIVLTGNGRILVLDIIFLANMKRYINQQYKKQVRLYLQQCKISYIEGKVKVIKIDNQINYDGGYGLIYKFQKKDIDDFSIIRSI